MYVEKTENLSEHIIIIDPYIHKKANLTRDEFLDRVANVKEIRTGENYSYTTFYICSFDDYINLQNFHEIINYAKFNFKNYHNFAIAVKPKLYNWFKTTDYSVIEKQITFWLASLYYFVPNKRSIVEKQLYPPLFEEILILIETHYKNFQLPDFDLLNQNLFDNNDESIFDEEDKCKIKYLKEIKKFTKFNPPEFLMSPFGYEHLEDWGINDSFGFNFFEAYFLPKDWNFIIKNNGVDSLKRAESRSDLWEKWKHTYGKFDKTKNPIYSFYHQSSKSEDSTKNQNLKRETINKTVKNDVWKRDEGKCVECGSNEKLEFDHIIPFSKGGSSTYRNIQLLCEPCNRKKSASI